MVDIVPSTISKELAPKTPTVPELGTVVYYNTDFSEYTTGQTPTGWDKKWHAPTYATFTVGTQSGATGGKVVNCSVAIADRCALEWNDNGGADFPHPESAEVLCRMRQTSAGGTYVCSVMARGSGTSSTETGYSVRINEADDLLVISRFNAGSHSNIASTSKTIEEDIWYWVRFRIFGNQIKAKMWTGADEDEPGGWDIEITDDVVTGTGWFGLLTWTSGAARQWDYFSLATHGGTAKYPPDISFSSALNSAATQDAPTLRSTIKPTQAASATVQDDPTAFVSINPSLLSAAVVQDAGGDFEVKYPRIPSTINAPGELPAPTLELYVLPNSAEANLTVSHNPDVYVSINPAALTMQATLPTPELHLRIRPSLLSAAVQQDAPTMELYLQPSQISQAVTQDAPHVLGKLWPGVIESSVSIPSQHVQLWKLPVGDLVANAIVPAPSVGSLLFPSTLTAGYTVEDPSLECLLDVKRFTMQTVLPAPAIAFTQEIPFDNWVERDVILPAPRMHTRITASTVASAGEPLDASAVRIFPASALSAGVTQPAPTMHTRIKPSYGKIWTWVIHLQVTSAVTITPSCISQAVAQDAPSLHFRISPDFILTTATFPAADVYTDIVIRRPIEKKGRPLPASITVTNIPQLVKPNAISIVKDPGEPDLHFRISAGTASAGRSVPDPTTIQFYRFLPGAISVPVVQATPTLQLYLEPSAISSAAELLTPDLSRFYPQDLQVPVTQHTPIVSSQSYLQAQTSSSTVTQPAPTLEMYLQPGVSSSSVTQDTPTLKMYLQPMVGSIGTIQHAPTMELSLEPSTISSAVEALAPDLSRLYPQDLQVPITQPSPTMELYLQPGAIANAVQQPAPSLLLYVEPLALASAGDPQTPTIELFLVPGLVAAGATQPQPTMVLTIEPSVISSAAELLTPDLSRFYPQDLQVPVTQPAPTLFLERFARPGVLSSAVTQPQSHVFQERFLVPELLSSAVQQPAAQAYTDWIPKTIWAPVLQYAPTVALFHTFQSVYVEATLASERHVLPEYIDLVLVPTS